jgi:hypothetical protein
MISQLTHGLTAGALAVILAVFLWPPISALGLLGALPPALLLGLGLRPGRRWGGWVAALMIPYVAVAAMNILAGPMPRGAAICLSVATAIAFVAGLAWTRSIGASLKA